MTEIQPTDNFLSLPEGETVTTAGWGLKISTFSAWLNKQPVITDDISTTASSVSTTSLPRVQMSLTIEGSLLPHLNASDEVSATGSKLHLPDIKLFLALQDLSDKFEFHPGSLDLSWLEDKKGIMISSRDGPTWAAGLKVFAVLALGVFVELKSKIVEVEEVF